MSLPVRVRSELSPSELRELVRQVVLQRLPNSSIRDLQLDLTGGFREAARRAWGSWIADTSNRLVYTSEAEYDGVRSRMVVLLLGDSPLLPRFDLKGRIAVELEPFLTAIDSALEIGFHARIEPVYSDITLIVQLDTLVVIEEAAVTA